MSAPRFFTGHAAHEGVLGLHRTWSPRAGMCRTSPPSTGRPCRGRVTQRSYSYFHTAWFLSASLKASILAAGPSASKGSKCSCESWRSGQRCGSSGAFWKLLASRVGASARRLLRPGHWGRLVVSLRGGLPLRGRI